MGTKEMGTKYELAQTFLAEQLRICARDMDGDGEESEAVFMNALADAIEAGTATASHWQEAFEIVGR